MRPGIATNGPTVADGIAAGGLRFNGTNAYVGVPDVVAEKFVRSDQLLVYPIHFENIGTAEARDVFVKDVLPPELDLDTVLAAPVVRAGARRLGETIGRASSCSRWCSAQVRDVAEASGGTDRPSVPRPRSIEGAGGSRGVAR